MRNPLSTVRDFIRDKGDRAKNLARTARETVEPIYEEVVGSRVDLPMNGKEDRGSSDDGGKADVGGNKAANGRARPRSGGGRDMGSMGQDMDGGPGAVGAVQPPRSEQPVVDEVQESSDATEQENEEHAQMSAQEEDQKQENQEQENEKQEDEEYADENQEAIRESLGHAVSNFIDHRSQPVRKFRAIFDDNGSGRHHETRHLIVSAGEWDGGIADARPDVLLDVPKLKVDEIDLEVDDLKARVALHAEVANMVNVEVGADVEIGGVELDIKGVDAQALLKVHLQEVRRILVRALETIEERPELITRAIEPARDVAGDATDGASDLGSVVGDSAGSAVSEGGAASEAAGQAGETVQRATTKNSGAAPSIQAQSKSSYDK